MSQESNVKSIDDDDAKTVTGSVHPSDEKDPGSPYGVSTIGIFLDNFTSDPTLISLRGMPAHIVGNPMSYIDRIVSDGFHGQSLLDNCSDGHGNISPEKLLERLNDTFQRIVEMIIDSRFDLFFQECSRADVITIYQRIFSFIAASHRVDKQFIEFASEHGVIPGSPGQTGHKRRITRPYMNAVRPQLLATQSFVSPGAVSGSGESVTDEEKPSRRSTVPVKPDTLIPGSGRKQTIPGLNLRDLLTDPQISQVARGDEPAPSLERDPTPVPEHISSVNPPPMPEESMLRWSEEQIEAVHRGAKHEFKNTFLGEFVKRASRKPPEVPNDSFSRILSSSIKNTRVTLWDGGGKAYPSYSAYYLDEGLGNTRRRELRSLAQHISEDRAYEVLGSNFSKMVKRFNVPQIFYCIARELQTEGKNAEGSIQALRDTLGVQPGVTPRIDLAVLSADEGQLDKIVAHMASIMVLNIGADLAKLKGEHLWLLYFYQEQQPELVREIYQPVYDCLYNFCLEQRHQQEKRRGEINHVVVSYLGEMSDGGAPTVLQVAGAVNEPVAVPVSQQVSAVMGAAVGSLSKTVDAPTGGTAVGDVTGAPPPAPQLDGHYSLHFEPVPSTRLTPTHILEAAKTGSNEKKGRLERLPPWVRKAIVGVLAGAALAGGAYAGKKFYDADRSDRMASVAPPTPKTPDLQVKSSQSATPGSTATVAPTVSSTAPTAVATPVAPSASAVPTRHETTSRNLAQPKEASIAPTLAPALSAAELAKIPNERLRNMIDSGTIRIEGNGGGFGAQLASEFYKNATPEQRQKLKDIQHKFNVGAYATYVERFPTNGDVQSAQHDAGNAYHHLAKTITRDGYMGNPAQWDRDILSRPTGSTWTPAEARESFKKTEAMMHKLHYDYRSENNIHMGSRGGDQFDLRDETGQFLPYFVDMAEALDIHLNVVVAPGAAPRTPGIIPNNGAPQNGPSNGVAPAPQNDVDGGLHGFLQFNAPHNNEDNSIDVDLSDLEGPKAPTLEDKIAAVKSDRRKALVERGEVWVPALTDDMSGSVLQAVENGFIKECTTEQQMAQVKNICSTIRLSRMNEYEVLENGSTFGRIGNEHLAKLNGVVTYAAPVKIISNGPVDTSDIDGGWDIESKVASNGPDTSEIDDGWENIEIRVDKTLENVKLAA